MTEEIHKFTKYMFLIAGFVALTFSIAFLFLWEWFFKGIQQWPFDDPGLPLIFGAAILSFSVMGFITFFTAKTWSAVKIPLITFLVFSWGGIPVMLYVQFTMPVHNWNWFNTLSYLMIGAGFVAALILQLKANKSE
ncbi:MAG: hypothetical protein H7641_14765 [Candidatus Heimdallarchaeota archaeon]|nr:hypothetical protein [Candidatus Heimdallarchaeota archaeon]MCK4878824.1 hypothetical protein [Candidatus Heimdallarchaeota archaeon]